MVVTVTDQTGSKMKVLVTGATGFVGTTLVPHLLQSGHRVIVVTRNAERLQQCSWSGSVDVLVADLAAAEVCQRATAAVDAVIHLADLAHLRTTGDGHRQSLVRLQQLAEAASAAGVARFIYISSCKAKYPAHSSYGFCKKAAEDYLLRMKSPMEVVCLRPGIIYGNNMRNNLQTLLRILQRRNLPLFPSAQGPISMISVDDCARAITTALTAPALREDVWDLNDGETYTLDSLVSMIRQHYGLALPAWRLPPLLLWCLCALCEPLSRCGLLPLGLATCRVLYREAYPPDARFAEAGGFVASSRFLHFLRQQTPP